MSMHVTKRSHAGSENAAGGIVGAASAVEWSVDQLHVADGMLCAMGWYAGSTQPDSLSASLVLYFSSGLALRFPLNRSQIREDVASDRPAFPSRCGFFLYTSVPAEGYPERVSIEIALDAERFLHFPLRFGPSASSLGLHGKLGLLARMARRFYIHARQGNWRLIRQRVIDNAPSLFLRRASVSDLARRLASLPEGAVLLVDHSLGGGANHYRDELIQRYLDEGRCVLLLSFSPLALNHQLSFSHPDGDAIRFSVGSGVWDSLIACEQIGLAVYNNCVSFPRPEEIPLQLARFVDAYPGTRKLTLLVHDFYMVCPSHFLLNAQGRYCGLPGLDACRGCLVAHDDPLVGLYADRDMVRWRKHWAEALARATDLICFSENTRSLFIKAYPDITNDRLTVVPHKVDYLKGNYSPDFSAPRLRVAMVGQIGKHKGSSEYIELMAVAERRDCPVDFYVIGSLESANKPSRLVETGCYGRDELAGLLNKHKIHMVLMLSISPETFSYVTHELIKLGVPLLSFDVGAQGDAIAKYSLGRTAPLGAGGDVLLDCIDSFWCELKGT